MSPLGPAEKEEPPSPANAVDAERKPVARAVKVEFGSGSHIGKVRNENQDHFSIVRIARTLDVVGSNLQAGDMPEHVEDVAYGMVVADGMGGMVGGRRASLLAIQTGIKLVLESPSWALRIDEQEGRRLIERMQGYFHEVDAALFRVTDDDPALFGMGTTLTVFYTQGTMHSSFTRETPGSTCFEAARFAG